MGFLAEKRSSTGIFEGRRLMTPEAFQRGETLRTALLFYQISHKKSMQKGGETE
jgi:hypothetical protein